MWLFLFTFFGICIWLLAVRWRGVQIVLDLKDRIVFAWSLPGPGYFDVLFNADAESVLPWVTKLNSTYGRFYRVWFAEDLTLFVSDPDLIKDILSATNGIIDKAADYEVTEAWLGKGILTSGGDAWHRRRKLLTPAFHFHILHSFRGAMDECCATMVERLRVMADGERVVDVYPFVSLMALDAICETAMGIKINAQLNSDSEFVTATQTMCKVVHEQLFSVWQRFPIFFNRTANGRRSRAALDILLGMTRRVIAARRKEIAEEDSSRKGDGNIGADEDAINPSKKQRFPFLDALLRAQNAGAQLTDQDIVDEVNTIMFEGHDTTSSAISFAMFMLSQHADVQQRARDEVHAHDDDDDADTTTDSMPYLEAVIKETLRLYPSVPFYSRNVTQATRIGEHLVPRGTTVVVMAYSVQRDERYFPNAEQFDPDRWLRAATTTDVHNHHPFAHVAFSAGPRNCIGQKYAMLEMKCALSQVLRAFELLPGTADSEPKLVARLTLNSRNGVHMRLRCRRVDNEER